MIGDTIQTLRIACGLTIDQLAEVIGVSKQAVENYEANIWQPGTQVITKMAACFGVTRQEISNGYSLLYDDDRCEIVVVRNMGNNKIRVIGKIQDELCKVARKEVDHL